MQQNSFRLMFGTVAAEQKEGTVRENIILHRKIYAIFACVFSGVAADWIT
jgi:hypothetical protein